jgi:transposase
VRRAALARCPVAGGRGRARCGPRSGPRRGPRRWTVRGGSGIEDRDAIDAALDHGLSQGLIESTNTKIRLLTRIAFGFHSAEAPIALAMLAFGGHRPALSGRTKHPRIKSVGPILPAIAEDHLLVTISCHGRDTTGASVRVW